MFHDKDVVVQADKKKKKILIIIHNAFQHKNASTQGIQCNMQLILLIVNKK